ncbi:MAG: phage tail assembly chaperone [Paracoccaceae bacterium]
MSITITEVRNAQALDDTNTRFDVEIKHPEFDWIPYTLDPSDTDMTVNNDDLLALIGDDFAAYVPPTQEELDEEAANAVRAERDWKLANEVDPIVSNPLRWNDMSAEEQAAWAQYRTDLLNVPQQEGFPHNVVWPTKPE